MSATITDQLRTLPENSLAAVFYAPGHPFELRHVPLPKNLAAGEALVRVSCCTLCGSDLSTLAGHRQEPTPCILGHEIVGIIEAVGDSALLDARGRCVRLGDRVVWSVAASCDQCRCCLRGVPQKCIHLKKYGHTPLMDDWQLSGGLAEFCHLRRGTKMVVVNRELEDDVLAPASCATATVAAALRRAGQVSGARVLIFGAGLLGLTACAWAKTRDAQSITICDPSLERSELAKRFGADLALSPADFSQVRQPAFDVILEMSGSVDAIRTALLVADIGAVMVLVGSVRPTPAIEILPEQLVRQLWSIKGVHNYCPEDLVSAVDFLEEHAENFPLAEIGSRSFELSHINSVISTLGANPPVRIAIRP